MVYVQYFLLYMASHESALLFCSLVWQFVMYVRVSCFRHKLFLCALCGVLVGVRAPPTRKVGRSSSEWRATAPAALVVHVD